MKTFKTRKRNNLFFVYIGLFLISIAFSIKYLISNNLINNNGIISNFVNQNNDERFIFSNDFLFRYIFNENYVEKPLEENVFVENKNPPIINPKPIVYIYNTHQTETYQSSYLENYNIKSDVLIAAKILKEYLDDLGIPSLVETRSVKDRLNKLNYSYGKSYLVSREFMEDAKNKNSSLMYFVDLHRDSSVYEKTTTEINGEKYAKLLFVVGLDNKNYEPNLNMATELSEILKSKNNNLYRGIMKKSGEGVNGVYNQDFHSNTVLIEVGGQYNNISEVNNLLKVFAEVLKEYIERDINEEEKG